MPGTIENQHVEPNAHPSYDVRFSVNEKWIIAVEVDVAVIRNSFATKEDVQHIVTLLYEHKLDVLTALSKQREDFHAALAKQREDFYAALAQVQIDLGKTLMSHTWKLYGLASLVLGGVYFIARYVH